MLTMNFGLAWSIALAACTLAYYLTYRLISRKVNSRSETPETAKTAARLIYWSGGTVITFLLTFGNIAALGDSAAAKTLTAICVVLIPITAVLTFQDDLLGQALGERVMLRHSIRWNTTILSIVTLAGVALSFTPAA